MEIKIDDPEGYAVQDATNAKRIKHRFILLPHEQIGVFTSDHEIDGTDKKHNPQNNISYENFM